MQAATSCILHMRAMCCVSFSLPGGTMIRMPPPTKMLKISCAEPVTLFPACIWLGVAPIP